MLKKNTPQLFALIGAIALLSGAPALAQTAPAPADPAAATTAAPAPGAPTATAAAPGELAQPGSATSAPAPGADTSAAQAADSDGDGEGAAPAEGGGMTPVAMFLEADPVVKTVMIGLLLASVFTWTILIIKMIEFASLNRVSNRFIEAFREARSIPDMARIATDEQYEGNPLADMAAAASAEVELSRQAGLQISGEHRDSTLNRAQTAIGAVQSGLGKRLSSGMQFLASIGSSGPFIGLFGTVWGIMNSFIGIANTNTTNLAVVAPGIAEALLATGIGLFAAIPSVIFYNYFQTRIAAYGARTEGFVAELMNALSRQLDKGA